MARNGFLAVLFFLFLIFSDCSAAYFVWNFRKLVAVTNNSTKQVSPLPNPDSGGKGSNSSAADAEKPVERKKEDGLPSNNSSTVNTKDLNNGSNITTNSEHSSSNTGTNHDGKERSDGRTNSQLGTDGSCEGSYHSCKQKPMVACIKGFNSGFGDLVLLVQNEGDSTLKVNITIQRSAGITLKNHDIPKHHIVKINTSLTTGQSATIVLNAENAKCVLHVGPSVSEGNFFHQLPSYYKMVTPLYGAYVLFITVIITGGTWACCKFRKRRRQDGISYQELEMGLPESASVVRADTAEGWDQDWDDDWDEDKAVKSPGERHVGNISANGLSSRSSNRGGWEKDWDD